MKKLFFSLILVLSAISLFAQTPNYLTFTARGTTFYCTLETVGSPEIIPSFEYSRDGGLSWAELKPNESVFFYDGESICLRGNNPTGINTTLETNNYNHIGISKSGYGSNYFCDISGNIMSLIDNTGQTTEIPNDYCFANLFRNNDDIRFAPELSATTLKKGAYYGMFYDCGALQTAPALPALDVPADAYNQMFYNCAILTTAGRISAQTLSDHSCYQMFRSCSSLSEIPDLEATTLGPNCCEEMFNWCSALSKAPFLPATKLADYCYKNMFANCSKLDRVSVAFTDWGQATNPTESWLSSVPAMGKFIAPSTLSIPTTRNASSIPTSWAINKNYLTFTSTRGYTVQISFNKEGNPDCTIEYTIDGTNWYELTSSSVQFSTKMWLRGNNQGTAIDENNYAYFTNNGYDFDASGSIMSLIDGDGSTTTLSGKFNFYKLFFNCSNLASVPELPATTLTPSCYEYMFSGCNALMNAGQLPATTLAERCYNYMFERCSSLTTAPELPATTMAPACYDKMFKDCSDLVNIPESLPATTLARACYRSMFENCDDLKQAPELVATTLAPRCYETMFKGCTYLTQVKQLPATTLVDSCYMGMFEDCSRLNTLDVAFSAWTGEKSTEGWVSNVSATGRFTAPTALPSTRDASHIPAGWQTDETNYLTLTAVGSANFYVTHTGSPDCNVEYSLDGINWFDAYNSNGWIYLDDGQSVYLRRVVNGTSNLSISNYHQFQISGNMVASGNIMSLVDGIGDSNTTEIPCSYCFYRLFYGCSGLLQAPELPALVLKEGAYYAMFYGCSALTTAPELPATTLAAECYRSMFYNCTALKDAPLLLPAETMFYRSCYQMFYGCTALTKSPNLLFKNTAEECCRAMFSGCSKLVEVPDTLYPLELQTACYYDMFRSCTTIVNAPVILATSAGKQSCNTMFYGCSSLVHVPALHFVEVIGEDGLRSMFNSCSKLSALEVAFTEWPSIKQATYLWVSNVETNGRFTCSEQLPIVRGTSNIPSKWQVNTDYFNLYLNSYTTITLKQVGSPSNVGRIYYSTDLTNWTEMTPDFSTGSLSSGTRVYFRGENETINNDTTNYIYLQIEGSCTASGNIMSLLDNTGLSGLSSLEGKPYCFAYLFKNSTGLTTAPVLPMTTLSKGCYYGMFDGCTSLTKAPELPAETLPEECYAAMFRNSGLTKTPLLSATTMTANCYAEMFKNCQSLTSISGLPATTLAPNCYEQMFADCSQLKNAPQLPAEQLATECYKQMFINCSSLTTPATIGANTLAPGCFYEMYKNCTSLRNTPVLPWTDLTDNCYYGMFYGCTALTSVPQLPAINLTPYCYYQMFYGCTSLTGQPKLLATTPASHCYDQMFYNCSALHYMEVGFSTWPTNNATDNWLYGVGGSGMFKAPVELDEVRGASNIPNGWQYKTDYLTLTNTGTSYVDIYLYKSGSPSGMIDYNLTGEWQQATSSSQSFRLNPGDAINFKAHTTNETVSNDASNYWYFGFAGNVEASGNIMSLLDGTGVSGLTTISHAYCFYKLFTNCSGLITPPELPATTLAPACYAYMFNNCQYLTKAPNLPATEIPTEAYQYMFYYCTAVTQVPEFAATKFGDRACSCMFYHTGITETPEIDATEVGEEAFRAMYGYCTKLLTAADIKVPVLSKQCCYNMFGATSNSSTKLKTMGKIIADSIGYQACYQMFYGCTGLTEVGDISATKVGQEGCFAMFRGCTSLKNTPIMSVQKIYEKGCETMFYGCTGMTTALNMSSLGNIGNRGCYQMFYNCTQMTTAPAMPSLTTVDNSGCYQMFYNCSTLVAAPDLMAMNIGEKCYYQMFMNCKKITSASRLPATTIASDCYREMFHNCSTLVVVPELPATEMQPNCYRSMFHTCIALEEAPIIKAEPTATDCYSYMFSTCTKLRKLTVLFHSWGATTEWVTSVPTESDRIFVGPDDLIDERGSSRIPENWNFYHLHTVTLNLNNHASWDGTNRADSIIVDGVMTLPNIIPDAGYTFLNWNTKADGTGTKIGAPGEEYAFTEDKTIYAAMIANWADNIEILNWTNDKLEIRSLEAIASITTQVYNNATPDDMTHGEPLTAVENNLSACQIIGDVATYYINYNASDVASHPGNALVLTVKDAGGNTVGTAAVMIPVLVSGEANISSYSEELCAKTDIQITNGGKLTVDADRTTNHVKIQGGGKLVVPAGQTLTLQSLTMQGGAINNGIYTFCYPQLVANGHIDSETDIINYDYLLDAAQYYSLALPYDVNLSEVTYQDGAAAVIGLDGTAKYDYKVQYYDGQQRTTGVSSWKALPAGTTKLNAGQGYTIFAKPQVVKIKGGNSARQKYAILRLPMHVDFTSIAEQQKSVPVTAYGEGDSNVKANDKGWNLVGNPYLANFTSETGLTKNGIGQLVDDGLGGYEWEGNTRYVIIPSDNGQFYSQVEATSATLPAFKNFFVQIGTGDKLDFTLSNRAQNAPARAYMTEDESTREYMADITISNATSSDHMGVIVSQQYTDEYEINADLAKWINNGLNIYALSGTDQLAYIATNEESALNIPVGVAATVAGTYTISLTDKYDWSQWKAINLYDATTRQYINLLQGTYTFTLSKGMFNNRFSLTMERNENASVVTGSSTIHWNADAPVQVYDMLGRFIGTAIDNLPSGVYNIRQGENCQSIYIW